MSEQRISSASTSSSEVDDHPETASDPGESGDANGQSAIATAERSDVAALESRLQWALADLDNLRKRFDREVARQRNEQRTAVVAELLPVVDNLERALDHAGSEAGPLVEGVRAVRDQAVAVLARLGFSRYDDIGRPFDPARHEALGALPSDAPPGTIIATLRPGYATSETVLRPAGVIVSKGPD